MTDPTAETPTAKRPARRKNWDSPLARQEHAQQRRELAREAAERWERELDRARKFMRSRYSVVASTEETRRRNMVVKGMKPRLTAVMSSWGLNLPVNMTASSEISGWTDFEQIVVGYDERILVGNLTDEDGKPVMADPAAVAAIVIETRGIFYHEVGHNLFTVPINDLMYLAADEGHLRTIYSEDGNFTYVTPTNLGDKYRFADTFLRAWNALEDQRMEAALVAESPHIASYLTVLVSRRMLTSDNLSTSWALVAGRTYLPEAIRDRSKAAWGGGDTLGTADEVEGKVRRYMEATTATEMIDAIVAFIPTSQIDLGAQNTHVPPGESSTDGRGTLQDRADRVRRSAAPPSHDEGDGGEGKEDAEVAEPGRQAGTGHRSGDGSQYESIAEETVDAARKAVASEALATIEEIKNSKAFQEDMAETFGAYHRDTGELPYAERRAATDADDIATAHMLANGIEQSFRMATEDIAPHWETGQRRGVLDAMRYATRQPGDLEVFKNYVDGGEPGADLAVTLLLDVSFSMDHWYNRLGVAAWSVKEACRRLNIACEVATWDTEAELLYGVNDEPEEVPVVVDGGGTDPEYVFKTMLTEENERTHHLVLVMTDGAWSDKTTMHQYGHPNMTKVLVYFEDRGFFNTGGKMVDLSKGMVEVPELAKKLGTDEAFASNDLLDIPRIVESVILDFV